MMESSTNSALLEELASHSRGIRGKYRSDSSREIAKGNKASKDNNNNGLSSIQEKIKKMAGLNKEEIRKAAKAGLIGSDQTWNWIPANMDGLREGLKDIKKGRCKGPYSDVEELVSSLRP